MSVNFRGSKTEQNLINAFAGEAMAQNRYTLFASIARKEGYEQIGEIFELTAKNEYEHAKLFFKHIESIKNGNVNSEYPFEYGTTLENLLSAIKSEEEEYSRLYFDAEKIALEEGFDSVASTFKLVRNSEQHHAHRYQMLYDNLKNNTIFEKNENEIWICRKCGYIHKGKSAPDYCPNCHHKKAYFQLLCEKY